MVFVPLLVAVTILFVACSTRLDLLREVDESPIDPAPLPSRRGSERAAPKCPLPESPLAAAFPHLQMWIPARDTIYQATHAATGRKGPDIILRPADRHRELSDAA